MILTLMMNHSQSISQLSEVVRLVASIAVSVIGSLMWFMFVDRWKARGLF